MTQTQALAQFDAAVYKYAHQWIRYQSIRADFELEDLAQIGRIYILKALEEYDPEAGMTLSTYIIQRIRWGLNHSLRSNMPRAKRETVHFSIDNLNENQGDRWHPASPDSTTEDPRIQETKRFNSIVSSFPARTRCILKMRYIEGLTLKTVAQHFNITKERVRQIQLKALEQMEDQRIVTPNMEKKNESA